MSDQEQITNLATALGRALGLQEPGVDRLLQRVARSIGEPILDAEEVDLFSSDLLVSSVSSLLCAREEREVEERIRERQGVGEQLEEVVRFLEGLRLPAWFDRDWLANRCGLLEEVAEAIKKGR